MGGIAFPLGIVGLLLAAVAVVLAIMLLMVILVPLFKLIGWTVGGIFRLIGGTFRHVGRFISGMATDLFHGIGAIPAGLVFAFLSAGSVVIGRWSSAAHYAASMKNESRVALMSMYRVAVSHPLRFVGLGRILEGVEQRVPAAFAEAPGPEAPRRRARNAFDGYTIVGTLPTGGSGATLYIARPSEEKAEWLRKSGREVPDRVVIKTFSIHEGSSLPQIVRENRALESARRLGLVLEHDLNEERFYYVMPYVQGDHLEAVIRQMHAEAGSRGLSDRQMRTVVKYLTDVVTTLREYHEGGLWHKDIKPQNIVVSGNSAHIVDLGLITPLRSAMTLTTHGTEYFRDPEMVRMAFRGVKVHQVNGAKFDIYAAGAVLYYAVEHEFPLAHGLSEVTRACPPALKWVIRRAMAKYDDRYESAADMLGDLAAIAAAPDMATVRPADLPSMKGAGAKVADAVAAGAPRPEFISFAELDGAEKSAETPKRRSPKIEVHNWWTGAYREAGGVRTSESVRDQTRRAVQQAVELGREGKQRAREIVGAVREEVQRLRDENRGKKGKAVAVHVAGLGRKREPGRSAADQVRSARSRAAAIQKRAAEHRRRVVAPGERVSVPMLAAGLVAVGIVGGVGIAGWRTAESRMYSEGPWAPGATVEGATVYSSSKSLIAGAEGTPVETAREAKVHADWLSDSGLEKIVVQLPLEEGAEAMRQTLETVREAVEASIHAESARLQQPQFQPDRILSRLGELPMSYLVVNDYPDHSSVDAARIIERSASALEELGLNRVDDLDAEATVRRLVGQYAAEADNPQGHPSDAAADALGEWMITNNPEIGVVIWVYRDLSADSKTARAWVLAGGDEQERRERTGVVTQWLSAWQR